MTQEELDALSAAEEARVAEQQAVPREIADKYLAMTTEGWPLDLQLLRLCAAEAYSRGMADGYTNAVKQEK